MSPVEVQAHMGGADDTVLRLALVTVVAVGTTALVRARRHGWQASQPVWGHALMGVAMTTMLLPARWRPVPSLCWEPVFVAVGLAAGGAAAGKWRSGDFVGARHDADLLVGAVAMLVMCRASMPDPWLTGPLAAYFLIQAVAGGAAGLRRLGVGYGGAASPKASRAVLAAVMAWMLMSR
jgi:hypothetical protein